LRLQNLGLLLLEHGHNLDLQVVDFLFVPHDFLVVFL